MNTIKMLLNMLETQERVKREEKLEKNEQGDGKNARERKSEEMSLIETLMGRTAEENGMEKNRILTDINPKGVRVPPANSLYSRKIGSTFSKRSCSTRSQRLTGKIGRKEGMKTRDKPETSGDRSTRGEPKLWMNGKATIARLDVVKKWLVRVCGPINFLNDNRVSLKETIGFVRGQEKGILIGKNRD